MKTGWNETSYSADGITAKLKIGESEEDPCVVKIFDDHDSFVLYDGYDEEKARKAWSFISRLLSEK